jgi:hypothetical protein
MNLLFLIILHENNNYVIAFEVNNNEEVLIHIQGMAIFLTLFKI